jgi:hypothetical protein
MGAEAIALENAVRHVAVRGEDATARAAEVAAAVAAFQHYGSR